MSKAKGTCEFAKEQEKEFGREGCCYPHQMFMTCEYEDNSELKCKWGSNCPDCGKRRVWAFDYCFGFIELCMNQECGRDK